MEGLSMCASTLEAIAKADDHLRKILAKGLTKVSFPKSSEIPYRPVFRRHELAPPSGVSSSAQVSEKIPKVAHAFEQGLRSHPHPPVASESPAPPKVLLDKSTKKKKSQTKKKKKKSLKALTVKDASLPIFDATAEDDFCNEPGLSLPAASAGSKRSFAAPSARAPRLLTDSTRIEVKGPFDFVGSLLRTSSYQVTPSYSPKAIKPSPEAGLATIKDLSINDVVKGQNMANKGFPRGTSKTACSTASSELSSLTSVQPACIEEGASLKDSDKGKSTSSFIKEDLALKRLRLMGQVLKSSQKPALSSASKLDPPCEGGNISGLVRAEVLDAVSRSVLVAPKPDETGENRDPGRSQQECSPGFASKQQIAGFSAQDGIGKLIPDAHNGGSSLVIADIDSDSEVYASPVVTKRIKTLPSCWNESSDNELVSPTKRLLTTVASDMNAGDSELNTNVSKGGCVPDRTFVSITGAGEEQGVTTKNQPVSVSRQDSDHRKAPVSSPGIEAGQQEGAWHENPSRSQATVDSEHGQHVDQFTRKRNWSSQSTFLEDSGAIPDRKKKKKSKWLEMQERRERETKRAAEMRMHQKSIPCPSYRRYGECRNGDQCWYSHDCAIDKRPELCKYYVSDACLKGNSCPFMHSEYPCKYFHTFKSCRNGDACRFSHGEMTDDVRTVFENRLKYETDLRETARSLEAEVASPEENEPTVAHAPVASQQSHQTVGEEVSFTMPSLYYELK